jgi:hypothetical protein
MGRVQMRGVIVSTRPMAVYGGVRFTEQAVRSFAEKLRSDGMVFGLHHDPRVNIDAEVIDVTVANDDGEIIVEVTIEVDEDEFTRNGGARIGGFSVSATRKFLGTEGVEPAVIVSADAHWFDEAQLQAAYAAFVEQGMTAQANRLYQFSSVSTAVILLTFVGQQVATMPAGVICIYIHDSLKNFFSRSATGEFREGMPQIEINFDANTGRAIKLHIQASSEAVLKDALDKLPSIIESNTGGTYEYSEDRETWKQAD